MGSKAQIIVNGDFSNNSGNTRSATCGGSGYEWSGVTSWLRAFGTPHLAYKAPYPPAPGPTSFPNAVLLAAGNATSEGITIKYPFRPNRTYRIHIGWEFLPQPWYVEIWATDFAETNLYVCGPNCNENEYNGMPPNITAGDRIYYGANLPASATPGLMPRYWMKEKKDNQFTYTPTTTRDWFLIYPWKAPCGEAQGILSYVWIYPECGDDIYLDQVTDIGYSQYNKIFVGSQYGTSVPVTGIAQDVTVEAAAAIELNTNTNIVASSGKSMRFGINPNTCAYYPPHVYPTQASRDGEDFTDSTRTYQTGIPYGSVAADVGDGGESQQRSPTSASTVSAEDYEVKIYPNPANAHVVISLDLKTVSEVSLLLTDLTGRVILTRESRFESGSQTESLSLGSVPPGIYSLKVKVNGRVQTQKLSIMR